MLILLVRILHYVVPTISLSSSYSYTLLVLVFILGYCTMFIAQQSEGQPRLKVLLATR